MKKYLLFLGLFLALTQSARAAYVQSSKHDYLTTVTSTACTFSSNVTAGNVEIMFAASNTTNAANVTVASTRVTTWVKDQGLSDTTPHQFLYLFRGVVTSTGAETVTATIASGTTTFGSACLEYSATTALNATSSSGSGGALSITTTVATTTVVEAIITNIGAAAATGAFTNRQSIIFSGTTFAAIGDVNETSTGTFSAQYNPVGAAPVAMDALSAPAVVAVPRHR